MRAAMDHQRERLARALAGRQVTPATVVNPGQWVLVRFPEDQNRDKLVARWKGPYRVLKVDSESVIVVYDTVREEVKTVHIDDLVLFDWSWWPSDTAEDMKVAHAERLAKRGAGGARRPLIVRILNMRIKGQQAPVPPRTLLARWGAGCARGGIWSFWWSGPGRGLLRAGSRSSA